MFQVGREYILLNLCKNLFGKEIHMDVEVKKSGLFHVLKGVIVSYIVTLIFLGGLTFILWKMHASEGFLQGGITVTYIVSCFLGGFLAGKLAKEKRFLWGLAVGAIYFVVLLIFSLIMGQGEEMQVGHMAWVALLCAGSGMLGGMVS